MRKRNIVFHTWNMEQKKIGFHIGSGGSLMLDLGIWISWWTADLWANNDLKRRIRSNIEYYILFVYAFKHTFNLLCSQFGVSLSFQCDMARYAIYSELVNVFKKIFESFTFSNLKWCLFTQYVSRFWTNFRLFLLIFFVHCLLFISLHKPIHFLSKQIVEFDANSIPETNTHLSLS